MTVAASDLGVLEELAGALGLVDGGGAFREEWLSDPGAYLSAVLADEDQRSSLVGFVDEVLGGEERATDPDGLVWLPIVDAHTPAVTVYVVLDDRPADHVSIGVGVHVATSAPGSTTKVHVPLFRTAKKSRVGPPLAPVLIGTAEGVVTLATEITVDPAAPVPGEAHLGAVGIALEVPTAGGGPDPKLSLTLKSLQLPGAGAPRDLTVSVADASGLEDAVLDLVLGLVQAQAAALPPGPLTALAGLLGLRDGAGVPPLPVHELGTAGVHAVATWLESLLGNPTSRSAWLTQLAALLGGSVSGNHVALTIGVAQVTVALRAVTGSDGHTRLTPTVGVNVTASADAVVRAEANLCTVDLGGGSALALPGLSLQLVLGHRPDGGAVLLDQVGPPHVRIETLRAGFALDSARRPTLLIAADGVTIGSHVHATIDLSSPDAVADAGGALLGDIADEVLDRLGTAADAVRVLLGLAAPAGHPEVPTLDVGHFLQDPLGAVAEHWQSVVHDHPVAIPSLITTLRDLVADAGAAGGAVDGIGTAADPWRVRIAGPVALQSWVDGDRLTLGPAVKLVVDTLGQRCTRVETQLRISAVEIDLAGRHATFLPGIDAAMSLRARGRSQAVLSAGHLTLTADSVGFSVGWTPTGGLRAGLAAPNLALDVGSGPLPVPLPTIDAAGHVTLSASDWDAVEALLGAFATAGPTWLEELAATLGWTHRVRPPVGAAHLRLTNLVADAETALTDWLVALAVADVHLLVRGLSMLARLVGGTRGGGAGVLTGTGRPSDPWLLPLGRAAGSPRLAFWVAPDGPSVEVATTPTLLENWSPGLEGLDPSALAAALAVEAREADDVRDLLTGRPDVAAGFQALITRWAASDGRVVPPETDPDGVTVVRLADATSRDLPGLIGVDDLFDPSSATVVYVAVAAADALPWPDVPAERLVDLTAPGLAPAAFTTPAAADGEWYVALAGREAARIAAGDPDGVEGQAERLRGLLEALAGLPGGLVVVAEAAAGHAARRAAEAVTAVTDLVLLGTPFGPVSFAVLDTQPAADALRLLGRLLPPLTDEQSDDADLALGRGLAEGLLSLLPADDPARELQPPTPPPGAPRAGLNVIAVFGVVDEDGVRRGLTAAVAEGIAARSQAREAAPWADPSGLRVALQLPLPEGTPAVGDVTVSGFVQVGVVGIGVSAGGADLAPDREVDIRLELGRKDMWLSGGPDPGRAPGVRPDHELRRLSLDIAVPVAGPPAPARATITLHEPRTFGIARERWVVQPTGSPAPLGADAATPALPEVRILLAAAADALHATSGPAAAIASALQALGLLGPRGGSVPDAVDHLLHDAAAHLRSVLATEATRHALVVALRVLTGGTGATPDELIAPAGSLTVTADLGIRRLTLEGGAAPADFGLVSWSGLFTLEASGAASGEVTVGEPGATIAGGLEIHLTTGPGRVVARWYRPGRVAPDVIPLWPSPDPAAFARAAAQLVPAELARIALEVLRDLDETARPVVDAALTAVGLLGPPDEEGVRRVPLPVALLTDPVGWLRDGGVLGGADGFDAARIAATLDALKPLLGVAGRPGEWALAPGVSLHADTGAGGAPRIAFALDTSAFTPIPAADGRLVAGGSFALTLPNGVAPRVAVDLFAGLTGAAAGRKAVHVGFDGSAIVVFLRPATGADLPLYPTSAGLAQLAASAVTQALPLILDRLAGMAGQPGVPGQAGTLVAELGDALALRTAGNFSAAALQTWAADPAVALVARLPALSLAVVGQIADAVRPLLPGGVGADVLGPALRVHVGAATVLLTPSPFAIAVSADVTGIPAVHTAHVGVGLDHTGLTALDIELGPADIDAGGVTLRPFAGVHAGSAPTEGRRVELALGLGGVRRVGARWHLGGSFDLVVVDGGGEHTDPAQVALALLEAVLDLVVTFVMGTDAVQTVLAKHVGSATIRATLRGVVLEDVPNPTNLDAGLFGPAGLLGRLQRLALNVAQANPSVTVEDGLVIGLAADGGATKTLGVRLSLSKPVPLVQGDVTISLETDARWIRLPGGTSVPDGIVVDVLTAGPGVGAFAFAPGVSVNGIGLRFGKSGGPLLDTVVSVGSVALYLFGRVTGSERAGGVEVQLSDLAVGVSGARGGNPVAQGITGDAGHGPNKLAPKFSPALAVQKHGADTVLVSLRAGDGDGPWWLAIQRGFGPIYVEQVGFGVTVKQDQLERISILLDGRVSLFGLTAAVDDLQLTFVVASNASVFDPSRWAVDLGGLAISSNLGGILLEGGLRKFGSGDNVQYVGMLVARFAVYGLSVFGGYGQGVQDGQRFASFFAFGAVNGPIGGPPAFFVTGIGGGLGINRLLVIPTDLSHFDDYPFIKALDPAAQPSDDPMAELEQLSNTFPMARGSFWFAAGLSFTSFALVDGIVVVAVEVGDGVEIAILGLARMALPRPQFALVSIELGLVARFSTKEGVLWVQAQLTDNSWVLYKDVRLTGGFAYVTWFGGPNRGQFVLTIGGYHPRFHHDGYPEVPRLGLQWRLGPFITVKGESYFALTSEAVMAGGRLEVSATFGPAWAHVVFGADGIIYYDPFRFEVEVYASISAGVTIDVWIGEITISISISATIMVAGPKFHGRATFSIGPVDLAVEFGDSNQNAKVPIPWADFVRKYLEEASTGVARVVTAIPGKGALPPGTGPGGATDTGTADGSVAKPFTVFAEFEFMVTAAVPSKTLDLGGANVPFTPSSALGIAPMNIHDAATVLHLNLVGAPGDVTAKLQHELHHAPAFPVGVWGLPQPDDDRKVPAGEVIDAVDGVRLWTVADIPPGLPPIDYHRVETGTRLPLPFVNEAGARAAFIVEANDLAALVPAGATDDQVFAAGATWMAQAGNGRTALAALRGERAAPPRFGSLTDGLAPQTAKDAKVTLPEVQPTPPVDTGVRPPHATAVLTTPLSLPERPYVLTTVAEPGQAVSTAPPTLDSVHASVDLAVPGQLLQFGGVTGSVKSGTVVAAGQVPLTRLASGGAAAVGGRGAVRDGADRLAGMTGVLSGTRAAPSASVLGAGEVAVLRLPNASRDVADGARPSLVVDGGPARVVALAHGGAVLGDVTAAVQGGAAARTAGLALPRGTERLAVAIAGDTRAEAPGLFGWHTGSALAYVGWSTALAAGATVRAEGGTVRPTRHRRTAGWVRAAELVTGTAVVVTRFVSPVTVVVVAIDDPVGTDAARGISLGLSGALRPLGADGAPSPPLSALRGNRTFLAYEVEPDPEEPVVVSVASEDGWHLAGVLGGAGSAASVADLLASRGIDAAVRPVLPGVGGSRSLSWQQPKTRPKRPPSRKQRGKG